jgi:hypothetical protein
MWMRLAILLRLDVIKITKENAQMKSDNAGRKNTPWTTCKCPKNPIVVCSSLS